MVGFDVPSGGRRGPLDRLAPGPGLRRGEEAAQPTVGQRTDPPKRRGRRTAQPNIQWRCGFGRDRRTGHAEIPPGERRRILHQRRAQQPQRLVEHRRPLAVGNHEHLAFGRNRRAQPEHRKDPLGRERRQRRQLLGHQHRVPPRQHGDRRAHLQPVRPRQRKRHPDHRIDRRGVHQLGEPQRIHPGRLEMVDDGAQPVGGGIGAQPDAEADLHRRLPRRRRTPGYPRLGMVSLQACPMSRVRSTRPMPTHSAQDRARSASNSSEKCSAQRLQKSSSSRRPV
ncbi:hypothetical protein PICSAR65_02130 [Mycobacterium avium subsp. paratuberculosis]|nr:hypothetical protein PICSAR65_02130 [Mycobacterium avium subsp. paratuberculosis]